MAHKRGARRGTGEHRNQAPPVGTPSCIASRHAALRQQQIAAARRLAAVDAALDAPPTAVCRIAAARDRRSPFVYRARRRRW